MRPRQTIKTTKSTTSGISIESESESSEMLGNDLALAAITDEDLAFERSLQAMNFEEPNIEADPTPTLRHVREHSELLSDHMEGLRPASTVAELMDQVHLAKQAECDSIEATPAVIKYYCRKDFDAVAKVGYFMFHDIKVHMVGEFERASMADKQTVQQKMFGNSKLDSLAPIMSEQKK